MKKAKLSRDAAIAALTSATLALSSVTFAQDTEEEEVFELSPFVVTASDDEGYTATETLSGTRLKTEVRNISAPLTILTDEFLADIGATNFDDIVEFMPSTETYRFDDSDVRGEQARNGRTFSSRGFRANNQSRDFFNTNIPLDTYNSGPISFNRGPNSNLFGIGTAGGGLTFGYRQTPMDQVTSEVQVKFDSYGSQRYVLRHNRPLIENKLAIGVSFLNEEEEGFREPQYADRVSGTIGVQWRPAEYTTIQVNHERGTTKRLRPYNFATYDWTQTWLEAGSQPTNPVPGSRDDFNPPNANNVGKGIESIGNYRFIRILRSDLPIMEYNRSFGYGRRTRVNGNLERISITDERYLPLETNTAGFGGTNELDFDATLLRVQQRIFPGFYAELAARRENSAGTDHGMLGSNDQDIFIDPNPILGNGEDNPYFGQPYIESDTNTLSYDEATDEGWRIGLAYDQSLPDKELFGKRLGRIRLAGFYSDETGDSLDFRLTQKSKAGGDNTWHRLYLKDGFYLPPGLDINYTQAADGVGVPEIKTVWEEGTAAGDRNDRASANKATSLIGHALLLDDTLSLIAGWREDEATEESFDPGAESTQITKHATNSFGFVYHLTDWLSLFGNYGENFQPGDAARIDVYGKLMPENLGESTDVGLRFAFFNRKLTGGFTYYETDQINQHRNSLGNLVNDFDDVWDTLEYAYQTLDPDVIAAAGLPAAAPTRPTDDATALYSNNEDENNGNPGAIFADTLDSSSRGIEFELIANPTKNWRLSWSVSRHLSTVSAARKSTSPYYEQFRPIWESYLDPVNPDPNAQAYTIRAPTDADVDGSDIEWIQGDFEGATLDTMLRSIANDIDETNVEIGGQRFGNREWSSNLVTRYSFSDGKLKGWNVGGSARWRDEAVVGYGLDSATGFRDPSMPYLSGDYATLDAFIGYAGKLDNGVSWDATFRVRNLNRQDVWLSVAAAVDDGDGNRVDTRQVVMEPVLAELSARFRF